MNSGSGALTTICPMSDGLAPITVAPAADPLAQVALWAIGHPLERAARLTAAVIHRRMKALAPSTRSSVVVATIRGFWGEMTGPVRVTLGTVMAS